MTAKWRFPDARLLVFAKAPVPGQVKTRLAGQLGYRGAARLYRQMVDQTLARLTAGRYCPVELWCAPDRQHRFFASCQQDYGVSLKIQQGPDLGVRMSRALATALADCRYAVLIGGDCLSLTDDDLDAALTALRSGQDAVISPAEDGGYLLIGLRQAQPALFSGIRWSTSRVMTATRDRLHRAGLNWTELPTRWDIDRPADLRRLRRERLS